MLRAAALGLRNQPGSRGTATAVCPRLQLCQVWSAAGPRNMLPDFFPEAVVEVFCLRPRRPDARRRRPPVCGQWGRGLGDLSGRPASPVNTVALCTAERTARRQQRRQRDRAPVSHNAYQDSPMFRAGSPRRGRLDHCCNRSSSILPPHTREPAPSLIASEPSPGTA
jgi:hypothetical protein